MPIRILKKDKTKTIPVSHSKDHPDVKTAEKNIKKDREKAKEDFPILSKVFGTGNPKKDTEKAKRVADTLQTMASEIRTKTEGSFKKGGLSAGQKKIAAKAPPPDKIDAKDFAVLKKEKAKGRGMGLQDESIKPGKVMKAREGKMFKGYSKVFETGAEHGAKGKQPSTIVGVKPNVGKKVASKIPGRIGKTLGVVSMLVPAAYAAAKQYKDYKSAKNRDEAKVKKMGGGSVKKYSDGMSYKDMEPYGGKYAKKKNEMKATASENVKRLTTQPSAYDPETRYLVGEKRKGNSTTRTIRKTTDQVNLREAANKLREETGPGFNVSINTKSDLIRKKLIRPKPMAGRMGGGMMNKPMGYKSGVMVKARGCKLGRTRPTKMY